MKTYKQNNKQRIMNGLAVGAIALTYLTGCVGEPSVVYVTSSGEVINTEQVAHSVSGAPVSVASNCKGYTTQCALSVVIVNNGNKMVYTAFNPNIENIATLDAIIQAEINDLDSEKIQLFFKDDGYISSVIVEGAVYQP